jgi:peptidoglycan hydrolase-like protein with peptidoglycan-binding domain
MANVLEVLQAAGLDVEAEPGWETRRASRYSFDPNPGGTIGMIVHHTASGGSADMPCRNICVNGRAGLSGPLVQLLMGRSGRVLVISQNRCNHAGRGSSEVKKDLEAGRDITAEFDAGQGAYNAKALGRGNDFKSGNRVYWGLEVENSGTGEEYSQAQVKALVKLCAAMCAWQGWDHNRIIHHREHTSRKIDMSYTGPLREYIQKALANQRWQVPKSAVQTGKKASPKTSDASATLRKGDKGDHVVTLQKALNSIGYKISVDGSFQATTDLAVRRFQRKNRLTVDGIVGKQTWSRLRAKQTRPVVTTEARPYPGRVIKRGSRGPDVRWCQEHLGVRLIDGVFGKKSERATKQFQERRRLSKDGRIGPKTWSALTNN